MPYKYYEPQFVISPKDHLKMVEIVVDANKNGIGDYSIAIVKWDNVFKVAMRWNISQNEFGDPEKVAGRVMCIGNPQSRGVPTWFILPLDLDKAQEFNTYLTQAVSRIAELKKENK